uniref:DNA pilot protein n=1 Tax=Dulem virus 76 TaxID=3145787 RepID=A0AAU8B289_9VIRU
MGFLSSISKIVNPVGAMNEGLIGQFSGKSQQKDANNMAMTAWHLTNDYNHPIEQMNRLKAAGLNPLLVYGSGSVTGNTTSAPALTGGGISTPLETIAKVGGKALSAMQGLATLDQTHATTAAQNAAAGASAAQASNLNAMTAINEAKAGYEEKALIADLDYKRALAKKTAAEADIVQGEADIFGSVGGGKNASMLVKGAKSAAKTVRGFFR